MYVYEEEPSIKLLLKYIAACDLAYGLKERLLCFSRLTSQKSTTISVFTITAYLTNIAATIHYKSFSKTNVSPVWSGPWCIVTYESKTKTKTVISTSRTELICFFFFSPFIFFFNYYFSKFCGIHYYSFGIVEQPKRIGKENNLLPIFTSCFYPS